MDVEAIKRYLFGMEREPKLIQLRPGYGAQPNPGIPVQAFNASDPGLLDRGMNYLTQGGGLMDPETAYLQGLLSQQAASPEQAALMRRTPRVSGTQAIQVLRRKRMPV